MLWENWCLEYGQWKLSIFRTSNIYLWDMDSQNSPYSGHQKLMSRICVKKTIHILDIDLSMYRTLGKGQSTWSLNCNIMTTKSCYLLSQWHTRKSTVIAVSALTSALPLKNTVTWRKITFPHMKLSPHSKLLSLSIKLLIKVLGAETYLVCTWFFGNYHIKIRKGVHSGQLRHVISHQKIKPFWSELNKQASSGPNREETGKLEAEITK